jgi:hypothetical protein
LRGCEVPRFRTCGSDRHFEDVVGGGEPSPWSVADGGQGNPAECDATVWYQVGGGVSLLLEVGIFFNYADIMVD